MRQKTKAGMGRGEMGPMCDGGLCVCAVWVCFGAVCAHTVVCRRRRLQGNGISTITNGTFAELTALFELYGVGLKAWAGFVTCRLVFWMCGIGAGLLFFAMA